MTTDKHHYAPVERSKEMLLKHAPLILQMGEDGTLDHTLPTFPGFSLEEVETLMLAAVAGKMRGAGIGAEEVKALRALKAGKVEVDDYDERLKSVAATAELSGDEVKELLQWAFCVRTAAVCFDLVTQGETEFARVFLNRCRDQGLDVVVELLNERVRDMRKETKGWSKDDWKCRSFKPCFDNCQLGLVLDGHILPQGIREGEVVSFCLTPKGRQRAQQVEEADTRQDRG